MLPQMKTREYKMALHLKKSKLSIVLSTLTHASLLLAALTLFSCDEEEELAPTLNAGKTFMIFNHTGHLVQQSSTVCGQGITAKFLLTSRLDQKEYVFYPDSFRSVSLDVEVGEIMNIKVYEVMPAGDVLVMERNMNFNPKADASLDVPTMILCPKDELQFEGF